MARYYLEDRIIHPYDEGVLSGRTPERIFHLEADGNVKEVSQPKELEDGEGLLMYAGKFYVEPLEIQIEFIKAAGPEKWLEGLLLRHVERVREVEDNLWVMTDFKEVPHES